MVSIFGFDEVSGQGHNGRPSSSHKSCETLSAATTRNQTNPDLSLAHPRSFISHTNIARQCQFTSSADTEPMNGGDYWFLKIGYTLIDASPKDSFPLLFW